MRIDVGDLELAARRARQRRGDIANIGVIEIESGHRPVRARLTGFLDDRHRLVAGIELDHTVGRRIADPIGVDHGALAPCAALGDRRQRIAVEQIVAQDQPDAIAADEVATDDEDLGDAARLGLHGVADREPPLPAIAEQPAIRVLVLRIDDQQDLAAARQHQRGERVVDHRLVVDRQELLVRSPCHRVKPRAAAA